MKIIKDESFMISNLNVELQLGLSVLRSVEAVRDWIDDLNAKHVVRHEKLDQWLICSIETVKRYAEDGTFVSKDEFTTVLEKYPDAEQCV